MHNTGYTAVIGSADEDCRQPLIDIQSAGSIDRDVLDRKKSDFTGKRREAVFLKEMIHVIESFLLGEITDRLFDLGKIFAGFTPAFSCVNSRTLRKARKG